MCSQCFLFLSEASFACPACNKGEYFGRRHKRCGPKSTPEGVVSLWDYEGLAKDLVHRTKYESLIEIPQELSQYAFSVMREDETRFSEFLPFFLKEDTAISYVPLTKKKEKRRGFNQAREVAKNMGSMAQKEPISLLCKKRETKQQTKLSKEERVENIKGSFVCNFKKEEAPREVVLFDDVWTSGATMRECTKTLKRGGVKGIWGFTFCRVP